MAKAIINGQTIFGNVHLGEGGGASIEEMTQADEGAIYNGTTTNRVYKITATVFYTLA